MTPGKVKDFEFPSCWEDDMRMNSLFAPFRARNVNPTDWDSKIKFWESLIERWCVHQKTPILDVQVLCSHFRRKDKQPACLPEVVEHLKRNKILISKDLFYQMTEQSWQKWAVQVFVSKPLQWTLNKVRSTITRNNGSLDTLLVHWNAVKKIGQELLDSIPDDVKGKLVDTKYIQEMFNITSLEALDLVLHWLCSQNLIALENHNSNVVVKFPKRENDSLSISHVDKAVFSLEQKKQILQNNINKLELEKEQYLNEAKKQVAAKKMAMAKTSLKRKKTVENVMKKVSDAVDNIEHLLYEMQMAEMDSIILDCYETGMNTLNKYFKDNGLTKDRVMSTRNELEDILTFKSDIDNALSESLCGQDTNEANDDLEEELKNLLGQNLPLEKQSSITDMDALTEKLPDVPSDSPKDLEKLAKKLAVVSL